MWLLLGPEFNLCFSHHHRHRVVLNCSGSLWAFHQRGTREAQEWVHGFWHRGGHSRGPAQMLQQHVDANNQHLVEKAGHITFRGDPNGSPRQSLGVCKALSCFQIRFQWRGRRFFCQVFRINSCSSSLTNMVAHWRGMLWAMPWASMSQNGFWVDCWWCMPIWFLGLFQTFGKAQFFQRQRLGNYVHHLCFFCETECFSMSLCHISWPAINRHGNISKSFGSRRFHSTCFGFLCT